MFSGSESDALLARDIKHSEALVKSLGLINSAFICLSMTRNHFFLITLSSYAQFTTL